MPDDVGSALALARIESKLERLADKVDVILRDTMDHEARIRTLEYKPVVTTKMLATVVVCGTALASIIPIINLVHIGG